MKRFAKPALPWLVILMLLGAAPATLQAQVTWSSSEDCKCVDADGEEIENCVCIVTGGEGSAAWQFAPSGRSKARLGITLSVRVDEGNVSGPRVESVLEDGPADRAGIREGDIITHVGGHSVFEPLPDADAEDELDLDGAVPTQRLLHLAQELEPGQEVEIRYTRDGEPMTTTLVAEELDDWGRSWSFNLGEGGNLGEFEFPENWSEGENVFFHRSPEGFQFRAPGGEGNVLFWDEDDEEGPRAFFRKFRDDDTGAFTFYAPEGGDTPVRYGQFLGGDYLNECPGESGAAVWTVGFGCLGGLETEELNPELGDYFGTDGGVLVLNVHEDSKLGLQAGDVILRVGDREVTTPRALNRILRSYEADEEVTLTIMRKSREMSVSGTLGG